VTLAVIATDASTAKPMQAVFITMPPNGKYPYNRIDPQNQKIEQN
jgi:hypothetical protein